MTISTAGAAGAQPKDANYEAAYLHVLTDLMQSVGVAIAGKQTNMYASQQRLTTHLCHLPSPHIVMLYFCRGDHLVEATVADHRSAVHVRLLGTGAAVIGALDAPPSDYSCRGRTGTRKCFR